MGLFKKKKDKTSHSAGSRNIVTQDDVWDELKKNFKETTVDITQVQEDFKRDIVRPGVIARMPLEEQWSCQLGYFVAKGVSVAEAMFLIMENELE